MKVFAGVLVFLLLLVFFHSFILTGYARFFEVSNAEKDADAIICLSGGQADPRSGIDPTLVGGIWPGVIFDGRKIVECEI